MNEQNPKSPAFAFLSQHGAVLVRYSALADNIEHLSLSIANRKAAYIAYRWQRSTEPVKNDGQPYCLTRHRDKLNLLGFKPEGDAFRTWKLNRIEAAEFDSMPFVRRADFNVQQFLSGSLDINHEAGDGQVTIRFASQAARYAEEFQRRSCQQCEQQPDGSLLVRLALSGTTEVKSWVISFGRHAEVLGPKELRNDVREELQAALDAYADRPRRTVGTTPKRRFRESR